MYSATKTLRLLISGWWRLKMGWRQAIVVHLWLGCEFACCLFSSCFSNAGNKTRHQDQSNDFRERRRCCSESLELLSDLKRQLKVLSHELVGTEVTLEEESKLHKKLKQSQVILKILTEIEHDRIHGIDTIRKKYNADAIAGQETKTSWPTVTKELGEELQFNKLLAVGKPRKNVVG